MIRDYQIPITLSALHVYHSGVVSMPECGLRDRSLNLNTTRLVSERGHRWQAGTMVLEDRSGAVYSTAISTDGQRIVSGSMGGMVRVWDAVSGMLLHSWRTHACGTVASVAFSHDESRIVACSGYIPITVEVWDIVSGSLQHT
jgi:WD40 repeat protein